jgi:hypothetical protein
MATLNLQKSENGPFNMLRAKTNSDDPVQRGFALKLNKYLAPLEKVFQQYAIETNSKMGLNNFMRFLKDYQLLAASNS